MTKRRKNIKDDPLEPYTHTHTEKKNPSNVNVDPSNTETGTKCWTTSGSYWWPHNVKCIWYVQDEVQRDDALFGRLLTSVKDFFFLPPSNEKSAPQIQHCDNYVSVCLCWCNLNCKMTEVSYFLQGSISCQTEVPFHGVHILFPLLSARGEGWIKVPQVVPCVSTEQTVLLSIQDFPKILERKSQKQVFFYLSFLHCPFKG